jgi:hypothetical protein
VRRVVYVVVGIVTINIALMVTMYVHMRKDEGCDTASRGLVVRNEETGAWLQVWTPEEPSDLPPCQGRLSTELKVLPG